MLTWQEEFRDIKSMHEVTFNLYNTILLIKHEMKHYLKIKDFDPSYNKNILLFPPPRSACSGL